MKKYVILLCVALLATTYVSKAANSVNGIWYEFDSNTLTASVLPKEGAYRTSTYSNPYYGYSGDIVIPETVVEYNVTYTVTSISANAFRDCIFLYSVSLPNTITSVGESAFVGLTNLSAPVYNSHIFACLPLSYSGEYVITDGIETICSGAFSGCTGVTSIEIPSSVTSIGKAAFYGCTGLPVIDNLRYADTYLVEAANKTLSTYTIKEGTRWIGDFAFSGCTGLTAIKIPISVTSFGYYAFYGCSSLTSVILNSNAVVNMNSTLKNIFGEQVTKYIIGDSITSIGQSAFSNCTGLTSVTIGNNVTSIGNNAFYNCTSLTSVTIGNNVTSIGDFALSGCTGLPSIEIPNSVTSIGSSAFYECKGLTSVTIGNSVNSIGSEAFAYCKSLPSIEIPNSVTSIGNNAFYNCTSLTSVTIGNNVTSIGDFAFSGCTGLPSIKIPNSVTSLGKRAFYYCESLISITIPDNVKSIGSEAFAYCKSLPSIEIPNSVTTIGYKAFYGCSSLTSIEIPNSVTGIGNNAFAYCSKLTDIYVTCGDLERIKRLLDYDSRVKYKPLPYSITIYAANGTVSSPLNICEALEITAIPDYGYHFAKWSDGNTDNPRIIKLTQDTTFVAEFAPNQYQINVTCDETYGHIEGENGKFDYLTTHEYKAVANYGYHFDRWSDGETKNPRTIVLKQDSTITAEFKPAKYRIQDGSDSNQGYINGTGSFDYLSERIITAVNQYGYHFTNWSDGSTDNPRTITLTQDTTFTAIFAIDKSGVCGLNNELVWSYEDKTKTLTISGTGALTSNYTFGVEAPTQMQNLIIGNEVTAIGSRAFYAKNTINHLIIGGNVASIGDYAFAECKNFDDITCYATNVPTISDKTFNNVGNKQYIYLYVPENRERAYKRDVNWGEFDIQVQSAESTTTNDEVTVVPADNTADITWPAVNGADTYDIEITKDGERICVLTFNANGQLVGIAFAPGRNGKKQTQAAGFKFTVTGLTSCTTYGYKIASKNASGGTINTKSGSFTTTGEPQGIEDILSPEKATKILRNGQILILRGDKTYTLQGQEVK